MSAPNVLVAFASQTGSTAGIARAIASELRRAGLAVDCRPAGEVADLSDYTAVILGSGVFLPRRASDGGGFITRHAAELATRRVWLFSAGPIGGMRANGANGMVGECNVLDVARSIGARGAAAFGALGLTPEVDPLDRLAPMDLDRVRSWARLIAADLGAGRRRTQPARSAAPAW
jgi:menaquinone-dependent protoporphyrinogen oxidase